MNFLKTGRIVDIERGTNGVAFTLDDGTQCHLSHRTAATIRFWLKVGQLVEVEGATQGDVFEADAAHLLDDAPARGFVPTRGQAGVVARAIHDIVKAIEALF